MLKLTPAQLRRATEIAGQIEQMEKARDDAQDTDLGIKLGGPTPARPMGSDYTAAVMVMVPATTIRMALVDQLAPLYTELRTLGIELQLQ